jgi:predicted ATPase with chaperone activity
MLTLEPAREVSWCLDRKGNTSVDQLTSDEGWLLKSVLGEVQAPASRSESLYPATEESPFFPVSPAALRETGLPETLVVGLVLKYLLHVGKTSGRDIARQVRLPFRVLDELLKSLRDEQVISYTRAAGVGDFEYLLTEQGRVQARQLQERSSYCGAAPVSMDQYADAVRRQSLSRCRVTPDMVSQAFADLTLSPHMVRRVGQALSGSATMLLFGNPGNGKTSIAERLIKPFADSIWIPRAISVDGDIIRVFDPALHHELPTQDPGDTDDRWVRIQRPIVMVGGELTLAALELTFNSFSHTYEAPVQLKSNCGVLLIDDFGRQKVDPVTILNRWIVPLEKRIDFLDLSNGKRVSMPFEQMLVFSTNLRPRDVVDEAFLRRITYKVEVTDPTEDQFRAVFRQVAHKLELAVADAELDELLSVHYRQANRAFRFCHARDLLQQVATACEFTGQSRRVTRDLLEDAVRNYFCLA